MVKVKFPDGAIKEFENGATVETVAQSISTSLAKKAVAGRYNGKLIDFNAPLEADGEIEIITKDSEDGLKVLWQTASLLLGASLSDLYSEC